MKKSNLISKLLMAGLALGIASGCQEVKIEDSKELTEEAIIRDVIYSPSQHGSGTSPQVGFDGDLNLTFGLEFTSISVPEKYAVVFECQHGKFVIQGTSERYKNLWEKCIENDTVDVLYREVYRNVYDDLDKDGEKELIEHSLVDYDFLDAIPRKKH